MSAPPECMRHCTSGTAHPMRCSSGNMRFFPDVGSAGAMSFSSWSVGRFSRAVITSARTKILRVGLARPSRKKNAARGVRGEKPSLGRCLGLSESTSGRKRAKRYCGTCLFSLQPGRKQGVAVFIATALPRRSSPQEYHSIFTAVRGFSFDSPAREG